MDSSFKTEDVKIWWKYEHGSLENDLKPLVNDEDATMLAICAKEIKCDIKIYTEARLSSGEKTYMESEEDRMHDFDEDMGKGAGTCRVDTGDGTGQMDNDQGIHKGFTTVEMQREHVIEDDYITDKLDIGADDDSDDGRPSMISRVLRTTSFRIKTLFQKHKYGRKFFNKNANADWVSRVIIDKLKNNSGMKLNEVVADVRLRFAIEIIRCKAFKARQLARKVVEGDSAKQYSMLWSDGAELRRASKGNTFKLNIPGFPPRFERWCFMSDKQKGLVNVFEEEYPEFEHRDLIMVVAKATYFDAHEDKMNQIKDVSPDAFGWLNVIPKNKWRKHTFPLYFKCDVLMNNQSESFNATILMQRNKPIITIFEWIRNYFMARFATLREKV
ncbi:unnamed protein product [Vicia faba]|uniref:Uncharacterized protein n=1 Tax=Vicia faba TaxID=3906 RepID=A0AAV1AIP5_VICFA|nr:unnamed protein product [Vicia faba]